MKAVVVDLITSAALEAAVLAAVADRMTLRVAGVDHPVWAPPDELELSVRVLTVKADGGLTVLGLLGDDRSSTVRVYREREKPAIAFFVIG